MLLGLLGVSIVQLYLAQSGFAACLLSYDSAEPLPQGDGLARLSFQGGSDGFGTHAEGRLGLTGDRSLHLRLGGCQRSELWGWALEAGLNQRILTTTDTGLVDLSVRVSAVALFADDDQNSHSELGFQPALLVSYPFELTSDRGGFVGLSLGVSSYFTDRRQRVEIQEGTGLQEELFLSSEWLWRPMVALSGGVDILPMLPLSLEIRWQTDGLYGGVGVGYLF